MSNVKNCSSCDVKMLKMSSKVKKISVKMLTLQKIADYSANWSRQESRIVNCTSLSSQEIQD